MRIQIYLNARVRCAHAYYWRAPRGCCSENHGPCRKILDFVIYEAYTPRLSREVDVVDLSASTCEYV